MMIVGAANLILGLAEIRQHVIPGPAGIAQLPPMVEVLALAARVHEPVNGTAATQHFAARPLDTAAACVGNRLRLIAPADLCIEHGAVVAHRDMDPGVAIARSGFEQ